MRAWNRVDVDDIALSWAREVRPLTATVALAQEAAATPAENYISEALRDQRATRTPAGLVVPEAFAGVASDGRPLEGALTSPAFRTLSRIGAGIDPVAALESGRSALLMIVGTQVADAARLADGVAIASRSRVGYVRMLNPPSCSRCAVLAGKFYRWNQGFLRHPRCRCQHIPAPENVPGDRTTDPRSYFDSLARDEQDRVFTNAGAQAIRDGSDIGQVVNTRRGMATADKGFTTEGVTRTGRVGGRGPQGPLGRGGRALGRTGRNVRLTPESIYSAADGDRDVAVSLLREHGYIA